MIERNPKNFLKLGGTYGSWTVVDLLESERMVKSRVKVVCICGTERKVNAQNILEGKSKSCGCHGVAVGESSRKSLFNSYQIAAKRNGHSFSLSREDFDELTVANCFYCGCLPHRESPYTRQNPKKGHLYNGLDRVNPSGGYELGNVVACCWDCNQAKHTKTPDHFGQWIQRLIAHRQEAVLLPVSEAYAIDYLSILLVKQERGLPVERELLHVKSCLASQIPLDRILASEEFATLNAANRSVFDAVAASKTSPTQIANRARYRAKVAMQKKFWPAKPLHEQKTRAES